MELSPGLLNILVLISISWTGITFIGAVIIFSYFIYTKCYRSKSIHPIKKHSILSIDHHSPSISPISVKARIKNTNQHKKSEQLAHHYDTNSILTDHSYSYNNPNKYQQQDYMHDKNDETTTTINENLMYGQRHQKKQYQAIKPIADIRILDRHTPYPPDVIAREKIMANTRFSMDNKY